MNIIKKDIMEKYKTSARDTGSSNIQIALLTNKILYLSEHVKIHKKDNHSKRGLLAAVTARKKHLAYLKKKNENQYQEIIQKLGLRK